MNKDYREIITNKIIESLQQGVMPWQCPFERSIFPVNYKTKHTYQGINTLVLWLSNRFNAYTSNNWIGYAQAQSLGGKVKKGEKGTPIVIYNLRKKIITNPTTGEEEIKSSSFFKNNYIFNLDQVEGLKIETENPDITYNDDVESILKNLGVTIRFKGESAFFDSKNDFINLPYKSKFNNKDSYYPTLLHELIHWTGHSNRLNRLNNATQSKRAEEELIAEIGASFLSAEYGLKHNLKNSASYIDSWLEILKDDLNVVFKASGKAIEAIKYIKSFIPEETTVKIA